MMSKKLAVLVSLTILSSMLPVNALPAHESWLNRRHDDVSTSATTTQKQNGQDAQKLNAKFATIKEIDPCSAGEMACINNAFAQCVNGKWATSACPSGTVCIALPLVNKAGTSIACDVQADALARFAVAGVGGGLDGKGTSAGESNTTNTNTTTDDEGGCEDDTTEDDTDTTSSGAAAAPAATSASSQRRLFGRQFTNELPSLTIASPVTATPVPTIATSQTIAPVLSSVPPSSLAAPVSQTTSPLPSSDPPNDPLPPQVTATISDGAASGTQPVTEVGLPNTVLSSATSVPPAISTIGPPPLFSTVTVTATVTVGCGTSSMTSVSGSLPPVSSTVPISSSPISTIVFPTSAGTTSIPVVSASATSSVTSTVSSDPNAPKPAIRVIGLSIVRASPSATATSSSASGFVY